jgi:hypothetical protein
VGCGCGGGKSFAGRSASRGGSAGRASMGAPVNFKPAPGAPTSHAPREAPRHIVMQSASLAQRRAQTRRTV